MATITAANSVFTLTIPDVFPTPQLLQGYATDDAFATDPVEPAEVVLGVDGIASAAFLPFLTKTIVALQADSPSLGIFDAWIGAMVADEETYLASGIVLLKSINKSYTLTKGVLTRSVQFPAAGKMLKPLSFEITWQKVVPAVV